jgi:predicted dehydrogenase/nucleoside-diphosphate-sugar epimerase
MKIAIVGCGDIARAHIPFIVKDSRHRIIGLCDEDVAKAEALAKTLGVQKVHRTLAELLEQQNPDVVHILTPPQSHAGLAMSALRAGCHVLVEKPMALSVEDADAMIATAKAHSVRLCVNHNQLFDPVVLKARRLVDQGFVGAVIGLESYYGFNLAQTSERQWVTNLPGGVFQNLAPHPLSLILHFLHDPLELQVSSLTTGTLGWHVPDELRVLMKGRDVLGTLSISLGVKPHLNFLRIYGSRAVLHVDLANMILSVERLRQLPKAAARGLMNVEHGAQIALGAVENAMKLILKRIKPYQGLGNLINRFYESIERGDEPPVTGEAGRRVVQVFEQIRTKLPRPSVRPWIPRRPTGAPTVFVTGATGFMGSHLVDRLTDQGAEVRALVRPGSKLNHLKTLNIDWVEGDLKDATTLTRAMEGCDIVYHCAATTSGSWSDYLAGTVQGTRHVLEASVDARIKRLVYISSLSVYPVNQFAQHASITEDAPLEPHPEQRGYYTQSKVEAEKLVIASREREALPIVILRPGTIYGPRGKVFFPRIGYGFRNRVFVILGRGNNILPLTYIENVVDAICLAGSREVAAGHIYNIVDDDPITQYEYLIEFLRSTGLTAFTVRVPLTAVSLLVSLLEAQASLARHAPLLSRYRLISATKDVRYNTSHANAHLGWKPNVSLQEGLKRTFEWYNALAKTAHANARI